MPSPAALFALISFQFLSHSGDPHSIGPWTLKVHADRFTGAATCSLTRPRIEYLRGALVFHLSRRTDTSNAVYRIDAGQPIAVREDAMELARDGFSLSTDDLDNPSGGLVRIPASRLAQARSVAIETALNGRVAEFKVDRLDAALDAAHKAGCTADSFE